MAGLTNLIPYSEDFSRWLLDGNQSSPTTTTNTNPDGSSEVYQIELNSGGNIYRTISVSSSTDYTFSIYIKGTGFGKLILSTPQSIPENYVDFTATSEWQRIELTGSCSSTSVRIAIGSWSNSSASGDIQIYGAQIEQGSYATSYIPTQGGSAVTRLADSCGQTPPDGVIGQTEGTLFLDFEFDGNETVAYPPIINIDDGTSSKRFGILRNPNDTIHIYMVNISTQFAVNTTQISGRLKIALGYANNDIAVYVNGVSLYTTNSVSIPTTNKISLNRFGFNSTLNTKSNIYDVKLYNTRLSNSELAALTQV